MRKYVHRKKVFEASSHRPQNINRCNLLQKANNQLKMFFVFSFGSSLMTLNHDDEESHAHWSVTLAIKVEFCLVWIFGSVENILMSLFSSECVCDGFEAKWSETLKFSPSNAMDAKTWNILDTVSICSQFTAKQRPHWSWKKRYTASAMVVYATVSLHGWASNRLLRENGWNCCCCCCE